MKALSIRQPWAWLVANGCKRVENRRWSTNFRGSVLIHAGLKYDGEDDSREWAWPDIERPEDFEFGGIVGECEIVDCVTSHPSPWFTGPFGFVIRNARPLPLRRCRGMLGFFEPDFTPRAARPRKAAKSSIDFGLHKIGDLFY